MPYPMLDRFRVRMKPLAQRPPKPNVRQEFIDPRSPLPPLSPQDRAAVDEVCARVVAAARAGRPVIAAFGAHTIRNGLAPVLGQLAADGWLTHLATNGAGIIHDWELAFQGHTCEDVREMVRLGQFGHWQETGFYLNLAINVGAFARLGYGESVGAMIRHDGLDIPTADALRKAIGLCIADDPRRAAGAADLLYVVDRFGLKPGWLAVPHAFKRHSLQARALELGVPLTGHPMIGHDIIYNHPMNQGACIGRAAERDFLAFAHAVSRIDGGVYLSVGSAVMSPMIFEKAFSMAQNLAIQGGRRIEGHYLAVVDLAPGAWNWSKGEPPADSPAYFLRFNKTFSRMGGTMRYMQMDNRAFLLALYQGLARAGPATGSAA